MALQLGVRHGKLEVEHRDLSTDTSVKVLAEHYQKTFELTLDLWRQRNRLSLILLALVTAAIALTAQVPEANNVLADIVARFTGAENDSQRLAELRQGLPYALIQAAFLAVIFYALVNLLHRTLHVQRMYDYLGKLEGDMRTMTNLGAYGFTREGSHYLAWSPRALRLIGVVYVGFLGLLIVAFVAMQTYRDLTSDTYWALAVDGVFGLPTIGCYAYYAKRAFG
jgi:hypothetical protein